MTLKSDAKFKEKLTCGFKYDMRNLVNFHPTTQKSKNFTSMGYFCPKYMRFELKKYRGVIFHDTEQWCKIWINPDLVVSKMAWEIGWTFIRAPKSLKNCTLMGSFCPKHSFRQKISEELCIITLKGVAKFKGKLTCGSKNDIRSLVSFHVSSRESENLNFDRTLFSKAYKDQDEQVQKSYFSWHWRVMQSFKNNWLLSSKMSWGIWWIFMGVVGSMKIWTLMCYFC